MPRALLRLKIIVFRITDGLLWWVATLPMSISCQRMSISLVWGIYCSSLKARSNNPEMVRRLLVTHKARCGVTSTGQNLTALFPSSSSYILSPSSSAVVGRPGLDTDVPFRAEHSTSFPHCPAVYLSIDYCPLQKDASFIKVESSLGLWV